VLDAITAKIARAATFRHGPALAVDIGSAQQMVRAAAGTGGLSLGEVLDGRQAAGILESRFKRLAAWLAATGRDTATKVAVRFAPDGAMTVSVDDGREEEVP
jgi:hypothetical protein